MRFSSPTYSALLAIAASTAFAQNITIPAVDGSIPAPGANGCAAGYYPGIDTVLYTVPYTYTQVLSIIGNYTNLTWSGSPDNSVTTNNTAALITNDWTPGSARFYDLAGAHVIETITTYSKPVNGPYVEVHTLAPLTIAAYNLSAYSSYDAQLWQPICNGAATTTNFTITFCATNVAVGAALLHSLHMSDAVTVGTFLGGQNFTSCAALAGNGTGNGTTSSGGSGSNATVPANSTVTSSSPPAVYTGAANELPVGTLTAVMLAFVAALATYLG